MPRLRKEEVADIDVKALDETEYTESEYERYDGEVPPANTELTGFVRAMFWCRTAEKDDGTGLDPMLKVLWVAADNEGDLEQYNGLPIVENLVLIPSVKFRWAPFFNVFGLTTKSVKTATYVSDEYDERWKGSPIEKIGGFTPGEDSDEAWSRVITGRRFYNDEWQAEAKKWLSWEAADEETEDEPEDVEDKETEDEETYDDEFEDAPEEDEEEEEEEEDEPTRPRGRGARASKPAAARAAAARPAGRRSGAKPAAAASSRRAAKPAAAKPAARGRGRGKAATDNEPPF